MKATVFSLLLLLAVILAIVVDTAAASGNLECRADKHKHKSHKGHKSHHKGHKSHHHHAQTHHQSVNADKAASTNNDETSSSSSSSSDDTYSGASKSSHPANHKLTPNGKKAGIAGGDSLKDLKNVIGWMTTWTPNPYPGTELGDVDFASMLWGLGESGHDDDTKRFEEFKKVPHGKYKYVIGFNEADFKGEGSSGVIPPAKAAAAWEQYIAPHKKAGSVLVSPSCAKQQDENWMGPFLKAVKTQPDVINVHIFKNKASDIKTVLDHFGKYNKPMWITEMACIDYSNGNHAFCSQEQTNDFVHEAVEILEADDRVAAYAWSDAYNGPACKLTNGGKLSQTGNTLHRVFTSLSKRSMVPQVVPRQTLATSPAYEGRHDS